MPNLSQEFAPFMRISSQHWRSLATSTEMPITAAEVKKLASIGDPITIAEADAIYRPLSALMQRYARNNRSLLAETDDFLNVHSPHTPWIIGIAGSVAVGKSTTARLLQALMSRWPDTPNVDLVPTDGFIYPNSYLEERGLLNRKGFPESYDFPALLNFLADVKAGKENLEVPIYDHVTYDILPGKTLKINRPDILIIEGLNVLQPPKYKADSADFRAVSDYFDFSIYIDAAETALEDWYMSRFHQLWEDALHNDESFFTNFTHLTPQEASQMARDVWRTINLPNLRENIAPTRSRATVILRKGANHSVEEVLLRKL